MQQQHTHREGFEYLIAAMVLALWAFGGGVCFGLWYAGCTP